MAAIFCLLFALAGCTGGEKEPTSQSTSDPKSSSMTVTIAKPSSTTLAKSLTVTGTVEAWQQLTVSSETSGLKILSIAVEIGDYVDHGDPLVYLNAANLRAQLQAARARHQSSLANLERAKRPNLPEQIAALRANVERSKAVVAQEEANLAQTRINQANASRTAARYTDALKEGFVTAVETDSRVTNRNAQLAAIRASEQRIVAAKASLEQARQDLKLAQNGARSEDVAVAQAQVQESLAAISQVQTQINQTVIHAPDSGVVISQKAFLGDIASPGQEILALARQGRLQLWATVPQDELGLLRVGESVKLLGSENEPQATIEEIDPKINPETRQGRIKISLDPKSSLKIGAFVKAEIALSDRQASMIPSIAIQGQTDAEFVYVLESSLARKRKVTLGERQGDLVEVVSGLTETDEVIVSGSAFLNDGDTVKVVKS